MYEHSNGLAAFQVFGSDASKEYDEGKDQCHAKADENTLWPLLAQISTTQVRRYLAFILSNNLMISNCFPWLLLNSEWSTVCSIVA